MFRNAIPACVLICVSGSAVQGSVVLCDQSMVAGGGTQRASQLWQDPSGQNDLDSDAIAWGEFHLTQTGTVTQVQWWGQAAPPQGFRLSFENQDPNTIAHQPDIFRPGAQPILRETHSTVSSQAVGGGLYLFTADLNQPIELQTDTRYFLSVVGLTPIPFATWGWAQGTAPGTFWWQRGAHMYFGLGDGRALRLIGDPVPAPGSAAVLLGLGGFAATRRRR